jgi:hypothetical protein
MSTRPTTTLLLAALAGFSGLLFADDPATQKIQVTHTETVPFPSAGRLRLKNSIGELTIQGWDRPDVEITTIKSTALAIAPAKRDKATRELDKVRIAAATQGEDLVIATEFPRHRGWLPTWRRHPNTDFDLEYRIMVPRNARIDVDHVRGEVHVDNLTSDVRVTDGNGTITLQVPADGQYDVDARSKLGAVDSDLPGHENRAHWFGHGFVQATPAAHKLYLRVGFGDIVILKMQKPVPLQ